ncbi:carboxypeptidase-like regulatory domain-containing protein [Aureisphaera sp. CAU 1614]|uniref:Carboxypeptidase-like regulatory domain-containing protein n=1 Tax=Halomarinibacterium sedimenti TaxID=2857106 RepID=A0A9X1JWA2_9FLAO|nr:carboxypeptidase-like regulatory domain-containing protein [Halomarinibacterium sedimenti]MBW2938884.1 carboxypeptidase-like regulatory domain-containing protein [Halomarinibacterium sedimenti]
MKYRYSKHFLTLLISLFFINTYGQIEIKSKISDFLTFEPIESASVYVQNSTIGTVSNIDGKFVLLVPQEHKNDTLVISSIGFKSFKTLVSEFDNTQEVFLEEDIASLDEVLIVADPRPTDGNGIVVRAMERLDRNMPNEPYLQKGFLRHRERNKKEYKWLIESALTLYDSSFASGSRKNLKINVDENRKSYDLRDVDSLFAYASYLRYHGGNKKLRSKNLLRDTIKTKTLVNAIKWNDSRLTGVENLFKGQLNLIRNSNTHDALFGKGMLDKHQFVLDTILVDDGRKLYKIRITKSKDFVGLNTENVYNEGFEAKGWIYIYYDNYAVKKLEYELVAASDVQKRRSKSLFDTNVNHKLVITYREYNDKMYPSYLYYETPKLVNIGDRSSDREKNEEEQGIDKDEQYYYTIQEILFSEVIQDPEIISESLRKEWSSDIFAPRPYNEGFWRNYNVLLESAEEEKLIRDLSKRASLFKE